MSKFAFWFDWVDLKEQELFQILTRYSLSPRLPSVHPLSKLSEGRGDELWLLSLYEHTVIRCWETFKAQDIYRTNRDKPVVVVQFVIFRLTYEFPPV